MRQPDTPLSIFEDSDIAGQIAKGSAELVRQTTSMLSHVSIFNRCGNNNNNNSYKADLVDAVIIIPSEEASVEASEISEASFGGGNSKLVCEGAIQEWLKEIKARRTARETQEAAKNLRRATTRQAQFMADKHHSTMIPSSTPRTSPRTSSAASFESSFEQNGILFERSDAATDSFATHNQHRPGYSESLF